MLSTISISPSEWQLRFYSSDMRHCLDRLEVEYPNCRAALTFFIDAGRVNQELRLAAMLSELWSLSRSDFGRDHRAKRAIDRGDAAPPRIRARALVELAFLYLIAGTYERAEFFSSSAILLARQAGNVHRLSQALFVHAHIIGIDDRRRYEAIMLLQEAVDLVHDHEPLLDIYACGAGRSWVDAA